MLRPVPNASNAICRHCGQRAPIVLRGIDAYCTACKGKRMPFSARTLNLAGKPSRIGGVAARIFGWVSIISGLALASFFGLLLWALFPGSVVVYAVTIPILIISLALGLTGIIGGRKLGAHGAGKERSARVEAVRALASHQGGAVTAAAAAQTLGIDPQQADALLTELAKEPNGDVTLDLDDDGNIHYLFGVGGEALREARWRFADVGAGARDLHAEAQQEAELEAQQQAQREAEQALRRR